MCNEDFSFEMLTDCFARSVNWVPSTLCGVTSCTPGCASALSAMTLKSVKPELLLKIWVFVFTPSAINPSTTTLTTSLLSFNLSSATLLSPLPLTAVLIFLTSLLTGMYRVTSSLQIRIRVLSKQQMTHPFLFYSFHFSQKGHANSALGLWNNLVEKVGEKKTYWRVGEATECPAPGDYLWTNKNSQ